jgi:DNA-binding transcriptional ArsR family regulator
MRVGEQQHFVYDQTMIVDDATDVAVSSIAACIAEPARTRMLYTLMDGHARTATELSVVGGVSPSTASAHLNRLTSAKLVKRVVQGKHRYYTLAGRSVARALEGLSVVAGGPSPRFVPTTPTPLRAARTCYDHVAGTVGVALHHRFLALQWLVPTAADSYETASAGDTGFQALGIKLEEVRSLRRRFAYPCVDWSERQPHLAGALGSAVLELMLKKRWMTAETGSRVLLVTRSGRQALVDHLQLEV